MLKASPTGQNNPSQEEYLPAKDLSDARRLVPILLLTWKNYSLYPENHTAVTKALENLAAAFDYFTGLRALRFAVKKIGVYAIPMFFMGFYRTLDPRISVSIL